MVDKDVCDFVMEELGKLVYYLASRYDSGDQVLMEKDEIVGELYYELAKGMEYYKHLDKKDLLAVLKTMLSNRISELKYKYFVTHRKEGTYAISIDILVQSIDDGVSDAHNLIKDPSQDVEGVLISKDIVMEVRDQLQPVTQIIFDAIVYGHDRLSWMVWLSAVRAAFVYKTGGTAKMHPWHIADALCIPVDQVKDSMAEIKEVVHEVYND